MTAAEGPASFAASTRASHRLGPWPGPVAGAAAGVAGLAVFLALHAVWILPIWSVVGLGLVVAVVGGALAGWAYRELHTRVPSRPMTAWLWVTTGAVLVFTPSFALSWLLGPYVPIVDGVPVAPMGDDVTAIALRFVLEFLVVTAATGAAAGWVLTRSHRAALATGAAALAFALGPGHNNPFFFTFGSTTALLTGLGLMLAVVATSSAVLVALARRPGSGSD